MERLCTSRCCRHTRRKASRWKPGAGSSQGTRPRTMPCILAPGPSTEYPSTQWLSPAVRSHPSFPTTTRWEWCFGLIWSACGGGCVCMCVFACWGGGGGGGREMGCVDVCVWRGGERWAVCVWRGGGGEREMGYVDVCLEGGGGVWTWMWRDRVKIVKSVLMPINVLYVNHVNVCDSNWYCLFYSTFHK